ncbi:MAG: FGGY-family carbohydrate kinase [Terriglobales bacterium]
MSLLAIDIGSSACKAVRFAVDGKILARHTSSYTPDFPRPSMAEMDPEKFWHAICASSRAVARDIVDPVQALCLSSHGETFVALDTNGRPVAPAILNQDNRAVSEAAWCENAIGRKRLFQITGLVAHPMYSIPKIIWLRQHRPEIFASAACFVTLIGYILQRMGLPPYVDDSLASRFLAFDIRKRCWSEEILTAAGLRKEQLPLPVPAGSIAGKLNSEAARDLGLVPGTPVVLGGHDQPCGALGVGVIGNGRVYDSIGTYECIVVGSNEPFLSDAAFHASLNSYCHVVPQKFVTLAYFPSGIMVKWFHDLLYSDGSGQASAETVGDGLEADHYCFLEAHVPEGPTGLCITPHLIGTCNPEFNPLARGAIAGLSPATTRGQLYKGILEGLACELSLMTEMLAEAAGDFRDIYVTGGGARSAVGLHLRAALTGCRLHVMASQEAVCLGTAILAGVAVGEYRDASQAVDQVVHETAVLAPNQATAASYADQMRQYRIFRAAMMARQDFHTHKEER